MEKNLVLFLGDILLFYLALWLTLIIRGPSFQELVLPFSLIFLTWLIVFYIAGLYDLDTNQDRLEFYSTLWKGTTVNGLIAIAIFYVGIGYLGVTPRAILIIYIVVFTALFILWRSLFRSFLKKFPENILIIGLTKQAKELNETLKDNTRYKVQAIVDKGFDFKKLILEKNIDLVLLSTNPHLSPAVTSDLFECLPLKFTDLPSFYEQAFKKIPITNISRVWFLDNFSQKRMYEFTKRIIDVAIGSFVLIITLPFWFLIALAIKWDSAGTVFYKQARIGKNEKEFTIWKFRTMVNNAEKNGAVWSTRNDSRITGVGKFLRDTRLDELPQLLNIISGSMALIGPRPERPEFVKTLKKEIPFYETRHLAKPGLSGWAQIMFRYGNSIQDSEEKLRYDLFYIKNCSLALDLGIVLRTIRIVLSKSGK